MKKKSDTASGTSWWVEFVRDLKMLLAEEVLEVTGE